MKLENSNQYNKENNIQLNNDKNDNKSNQKEYIKVNREEMYFFGQKDEIIKEYLEIQN